MRIKGSSVENTGKNVAKLTEMRKKEQVDRKASFTWDLV